MIHNQFLTDCADRAITTKKLFANFRNIFLFIFCLSLIISLCVVLRETAYIPLVILIFFSFLLIIFSNIKWLIAIVILFTACQTYAFPDARIISFSIETIREAIVLFAITLIVLIATKKNNFLKINIRDLPISYILLILFGLLSLVYTESVYYGIAYIAKLFYGLAIFFLFYIFINSKSDTKYLNKLITGIFFVYLLGTIINYLRGGSLSPDTGMLLWTNPGARAIGSFYCATLSLFFYHKYLASKSKKFLLLFLISLSALFFSFTRIAILGFFIGLLIHSALERRFKPMVLICILLLLYSLFFFNTLVKESFIVERGEVLNLLHKREITTLVSSIRLTGRERIWKFVIENCCQNLVVGAGLGTTTFKLKESFRFFDHPHSEYLTMFADLGIIGLLLFLLSFLEIIYKSIKLSVSGSNSTKHLANLVISLSIANLIFSLTDTFILYIPFSGIYIFIFYVLLNKEAKGVIGEVKSA